MSHPHPDQKHVMLCYRKFIISNKRKWGTFKGFMMRKQYLQTYLSAKKNVLNNKHLLKN